MSEIRIEAPNRQRGREEESKDAVEVILINIY
jgi:hypothetical protein